jgi:LacI family transcriptional regulator
MRDIARHCGVSVATVSMALRAHPRLPRATHERIERAARALGYRQNLLQGQVMAHRRAGTKENPPLSTLAYLTFARVRRPDVGYFYTQVHAGAEAAAHHRGCRLETIFGLEERMTPRRLTQILHARGIRGVIVAASATALKEFEHMDWRHFAAVAVGYSNLSETWFRVGPHHHVNALTALKAVRELGYQRPGLCVDTNRFVTRWLGGYLADAYVHGVEDPRVLVLQHPGEPDPRRVVRWLKSARPDVVLTDHGTLVDALRKAGVRIPEELGVCLLNRGAEDAAGVDQRPELVGEFAVDAVIELLGKGAFGPGGAPKILHVEGAWTPGPTLRTVGPPGRAPTQLLI